MTLNITEGCYVKLRNGAIMGPVEKRSSVKDYYWQCASAFSWTASGRYFIDNENPLDIIKILPGKPVFIDTPFEVGKKYQTRNGGERTVTGFGLLINNGSTRKLDGSYYFDGSTSLLDLLPGAIEDEEQVTVTMPKADYERAMELLKGARG